MLNGELDGGQRQRRKPRCGVHQGVMHLQRFKPLPGRQQCSAVQCRVGHCSTCALGPFLSPSPVSVQSLQTFDVPQGHSLDTRTHGDAMCARASLSLAALSPFLASSDLEQLAVELHVPVNAKGELQGER